MIRRASAIGVALVIGLFAVASQAAERFITVASTTSVRNSGLYDWILPKFTAKTGIEVRVVAVGTGQAIRIARRGDADVLLVHDRPSELKFVADGFGIGRREIMYNYFVVIGPAADPARVGQTGQATKAFRAIARSKAPFVSRGDDSGTHKLERRIWKAADLDPTAASGTWYREAGAGMGATINMASAMDAYTVTDKATWIASRNRGRLKILVAESPALKNQYSVMLVNPAKHPHVREKEGMAFIEWLVSKDGQSAMADYRVKDTQLFFPNADVAG